MKAETKRIVITIINFLIVAANLVVQHLSGIDGGVSDVAMGCLATYAAMV